MYSLCEVPAYANPPVAGLSLREKDLEIRLAGDEDDLTAAQRLRFEVFNLEFRMGLAGSFASGLDRDAFDAHCDHLVVVDHRQGCKVGTYRLLLSDRVPSYGYYSETEFHLDNVKRQGGHLLELGRICVAPDYRSGRVIHLLFRGIAVYAQANGVDAMMGCASIRGNDIEELRGVCTMLRKSYGADPKFRVTPKRGFDLPGLDAPVDIDEAEVFRKLPPLFKGYLRLGAKVCGPPPSTGSSERRISSSCSPPERSWKDTGGGFSPGRVLLRTFRLLLFAAGERMLLPGDWIWIHAVA